MEKKEGKAVKCVNNRVKYILDKILILFLIWQRQQNGKKKENKKKIKQTRKRLA